MTNKQIARVLKETGDLLVLTGGNPFRARAFSNAARTLERMEEPVTNRLDAGTLTQVRGIGKGLAAQIQELVDTGSFELRDDLLGAIPPGLPDMLRVKGLGAKRARRLWQELNITSLDELEQAAVMGRIAELDGFGEKTQENLLTNARRQQQYDKRRRYAHTFVQVDPLLQKLRQTPGVHRAELAGELRRKLQTIGLAELVVAAERVEDVQDALDDLLTTDLPTREGDEHLLSGALPDGLPLQVRLVGAERFGTALWRHTGSTAHVEAYEAAHGVPEDHAVESALYEEAGLPYILPELREDRGELEAARTGKLPNLIAMDDLRGTLHNHSTYSDGAHTLRQMAEAARSMGLSYFGICDHSQSLTVANGLSVERVHEQQEEIQALNDEFARTADAPFRIFSGIESDILKDGSLDYPDDVLATFDFIVASVHTGFNMTEEEATARVVRAIENPFTTILGHPTGRLLLARKGYPLDHERVIAACAEHGVAIELNANPYRLDLDWRWIREATRQGVSISINPDAHAIDELYNMRWGVEIARKGWLTPDQCLNAKPLDAFAAWLETHRTERVT